MGSNGLPILPRQDHLIAGVNRDGKPFDTYLAGVGLRHRRFPEEDIVAIGGSGFYPPPARSALRRTINF